MAASGVTIRALALPEVETLIEWAAAEGWNPGLADAARFQAADPDGFIGAFVDEELVAGISAVTYGDRYGFIGLYISRADMRGKGYGRAVWDRGMERLAGRTVGLDGVPAQQENYAGMGFVLAYRTTRYSGWLRQTLKATGARNISKRDYESIAAFDRECFPAPRCGFLERWLTPPHIGLMIEDGEGRLTGYGVARQCREGFKIGPLFARSDAVAIDLLTALAENCGGNFQVDVPARQTGFIDFLRDSRLVAGFETARMYRGKAPSMIQNGVFGITSLELG